MQLSEQQFCADWVARMGALTPLTTATVLQYLNLRAQADAGPVCKRIAHGTAADWWWHRDDVPVGTELFTHPEASAPGLSVAEAAFALLVYRCSNFKLSNYEAWTNEEEDSKPLWPRLEELGLIFSAGSYKWAPTQKLIDMLTAALTRASAATVGEASDARDAARYRKLRHVTGARRNPGGGQYFNIPSPPVHANILQGSVAQHLDAALDAWETGVAELDGAQQQAEPKCDDCNDTGQICVGTSGLESDGNAPLLERCPSCGYGEQQAETNRCNCAHVGECDGSCAPYVGQQAEHGEG